MLTKNLLKIALYHLLGVASFILSELVVLFFHETNVGFWDFAWFYGIDIGFFYASAYFFIQSIKRDVITVDIRFVVISLLWITLFTLLDLYFTYIQYEMRGLVLKQEKIRVDAARLFFRFTYFYLFAYGLWSARRLIKREKDHRVKDVALLTAENEKAQLEIALLRSQITPHLLLNTLNGVHTLVMASNPQASVLVELLMDNLRLSLKGSDPHQATTLEEELQLVKNIVHIYEQLGKRNCKLHIAISDDAQQIEFPVNLIATLVENVFKHGDLNDPDHPAEIAISQNADGLKVSISNRYRPDVSRERPGIGIANIKKRLDIQYRNRYDLRIDTSDACCYNTLLTIQL